MFFFPQSVMALLLLLGISLLALVQSTAVKNCHPGCRCEVESFGLFDSFSLTRVDCRRLGPGATMPIPIPLDTAHLDLSSITSGPLSDTMLSGPGYTTLVSLDLSCNHITAVSTLSILFTVIILLLIHTATLLARYTLSSLYSLIFIPSVLHTV